MSADTRELLAYVSVGLETIADASDRLPDVEVAAHACLVAERLQLAVEAILQGAATTADLVGLTEAIGEMRSLLRARGRGQGEVDLRKARIRRLARHRWAGSSGITIDTDADVVEDRDLGAYVAAWVWVPFGGTPFDPRRSS